MNYGSVKTVGEMPNRKYKIGERVRIEDAIHTSWNGTGAVQDHGKYMMYSVKMDDGRQGSFHENQLFTDDGLERILEKV